MANLSTETEPFNWDDVIQQSGVNPAAVQASPGAAGQYDPNQANGAPLQGFAPQAAAPAGGFDRTAFRDAWMSQAPGTSPAAFVAQHPEFSQGVQVGANNESITLPTGERLDSVIDKGGKNLPGWTTDAVQAAQYAAQYGGGQAPGGQAGQMRQQAPQGYQGGQGGYQGQPPGFTPYNAPAPFNYSPLGTPDAFGPQASVPTPGNLSYQNATTGQQFTPQQLGYQSLSTPDALRYQQVASPQSQTAQQISAPDAQTARQVADPSQLQYQRFGDPQQLQAQSFNGLSAEDLKADPSYQNRLKQELDSIENAAASKGVLRTGNTEKALIDYAGNSASQEYAAANARAMAANAQNNSYGLQAQQGNITNQFNAQNANNSNALGFGQANIQNGMQAIGQNNSANLAYGGQNFGQNLAATNSNNSANLAYGGQNFGQNFQATQANNANALGFGQQNIANTQNTQNTNNQNALGFGTANNQFGLAGNAQNFGQNFTVNQANNQGNNAATQGNFQNQLASQGQQFGQNAQGYGLNTSVPLAYRGQQFNEAEYQNNANNTNGANAWQMNNAGALGWTGSGQNQQQIDNSYALGQGNLALGNTQAANSYNLGLGNLGLGQTQAANSYNLGLGNLGLGQQQAADSYSLGVGNLNLGMGQLGLNATQGYGTNLSNLLTGQGNSTAAGQVGSANAWNGALSGIGNNLLTNAYLGQYGPNTGTRAQGSNS